MGWRRRGGQTAARTRERGPEILRPPVESLTPFPPPNTAPPGAHSAERRQRLHFITPSLENPARRVTGGWGVEVDRGEAQATALRPAKETLGLGAFGLRDGGRGYSGDYKVTHLGFHWSPPRAHAMFVFRLLHSCTLAGASWDVCELILSSS